jgi:hypothetical protein
MSGDRLPACFRNADAHARDADDLTRMDAEAAVIWFKGTISTVERTVSVPNTDDTMEEPDYGEDVDTVLEEGSISEETVPAAD